MSAPTITVKDVWRGVLPSGTDLLGGGGGLERRVEWACALRTRPPAFEAVKGGEIAFVPVKSIRLLDERLDLPQVMTSFAEKGGVAVAVVGDVSVESIAAADRLMMPLLRLPDGVHAGDAHHTCVRFILDQRALLHERAQELQLSLMDLALGGAGPDKIIAKLAEVTGLPAAWQNEAGEVRYLTASDLLLRDELGAEAEALRRWGLTIAALGADPPVHEFTLGRSGMAALVSPVPMRIGIGGFVSVIGDDQHLDQIARLAVARAASACAIDFDRERAVTETRDRLEGEFIASLLTGSYSSERVAQERAGRLGADLSGSVFVIALRGTIPSASWEAHALRAVQNVVARREVRALVAAHEDAVCLVAMPETDLGPDATYRLADTVRAECASTTGDASTSLGLGRTHDGAAGVRQSYREAEHALEMGRRLLGPGRQASFTDLGLHRLLFAMAQHPELGDYYRGTVGDLLAYDQRSSAELMTTLDAFFAANGSPTETAQRLHLHRNTVLYRLRRIEEVGHLRLDDPATRLNLHLCLRIRDVLQAGAARGAQPEPEAGPVG